jgi:hypothetical protein
VVQRSGSDEENDKYSKFILDSVAHMSRMLDDLLALTRIFAAAWNRPAIT